MLAGGGGARPAQLLYDPLGRLFQTSGGAAGITRFLYDGDALIAENDGAGTLQRRYAHRIGADVPVVEYIDHVLWRQGTNWRRRIGS